MTRAASEQSFRVTQLWFHKDMTVTAVRIEVSHKYKETPDVDVYVYDVTADGICRYDRDRITVPNHIVRFDHVIICRDLFFAMRADPNYKGFLQKSVEKGVTL